MTTNCLDCQATVSVFAGIEVGEIIECQNCGAEMEVINLKPLEVELIEEEK